MQSGYLIFYTLGGQNTHYKIINNYILNECHLNFLHGDFLFLILFFLFYELSSTMDKCHINFHIEFQTLSLRIHTQDIPTIQH